MYPLHQEAIRVTRVPATTAWHIPHGGGCDLARYRDRSPTTASEGQVAESHEETRQLRQPPPRRTLRAARSRALHRRPPQAAHRARRRTRHRPHGTVRAPAAEWTDTARPTGGSGCSTGRPSSPARRPPAARPARRSERGGQRHRPTGRQRRGPARFPAPTPPAAGPAIGGAARPDRCPPWPGPGAGPAIVRPGTERRARTAAAQRHRRHRTASGGAGDLTGTPAPAGSAHGSREARAGAPGLGVTSPPWPWRGNTGTASGRAARPCWTRGSGRRTSAAALRRSDPAPRATPRRSTTAPRRTR